MSNPKVIFTVIAAMMIISSFALVMNTNASDSDPGGEPEGQQWEGFLVNYGTRTFDDDWIPISNINDLQDISDLAGKYYLTNNIDLTNYYLSDSFDIKIDPSYDNQAEELTVTLSIIATDETVIPMHVSDIVMFVNGEEKEQTAGEAKVVFNVDPAVNDLLITAAGTVTNVDPTYDNTFVVSESFNMRDLVSVTINSKGNFTPIGSSASPFSGTIDGNGYSIIGLRTTSYVTTSDAYSGLIAYADGAIINNLGLEGGGVVALLSNVDRWVCAGGLIGYADSTIITNSYNKGIVTALSSSYQVYAGGLIGRTGSTTITNSYNEGIVTASSSLLLVVAGGLIGSAGSTSISNSYNSGIVTATSPASATVGGLTGGASSTSISDSYNTGTITSPISTSANVGGLVGWLFGEEKPIINSYNTGTIIALSEADMGGLVGFSWKTTIHSSYAMEITDSYTKLVGGRGITVLKDYDPNIPDPDGMKTTTEMKDQGTFYGWNFDTIWAIDTSGAENGGNPYLDPIGRWMDFIVDEGEGYDPKDAGGEWIELNNENFMDVMQDEGIDLAANYYLSENIDLTNVEGKGSFEIVVEPVVDGDKLTVTLKHGDNTIEVSEGSISINGQVTILDEEVATASHEMEDGIKEFRIVAGGIATNVAADDTRFAISTVITIPDSGDPDTIKIQSKGNFIPLGGYSSEFKGTIDGNGYCIIGLRTAVYSESSIDSGLIAYSDGATIRNLGLKGGSYVAISSSDYACVGGLIGDASSTKITNSYNTGDVTASTGTDAYVDAYAGGLIGYTESTTITNSYNTGDVTAYADAAASAGGLIGYTESTTITNSHNKGDVTAYADAYAEKYVDKNADAGAYAGAYAYADAYASAGGLIGYAGNATISESYNTGDIKARTYAYAYANAHAEAYAYADAGAEAEAYAEAYAGGLIGYAGNATISESYNTGYVTAHTYSRSYAYAYAETYVERDTDPAEYQDAETYAEADADAYARAQVGGLVGLGAKISITNSYNIGVTYADADANPYAHPEVKGANPSTVSSTSRGAPTYMGGLIGYVDNSETTIKSSYAESGKGADDLVGGGWGPDLDDYSCMKTTTEMKAKATFHEWDFDTIWAIDDAEDVADKENNGYPYLSSNCASDTVSVEVTSAFEPTGWSVKIFVGDDFVNDIGPSAEVTKGSKVTVVVTPPSDYDMALLFVNGKDVAFDNNTYVIESVSFDTSILVCFDSDMYVVTAKMADGETSTVSPSMAGVRKEVGEFDFIVQPDGNFIIGSASVSLEDAASVSYDQTTLTVTKVSEGCEVEIGMKVGSHKVNIVSTSGGTVSPTGTQTVEHGSSLSIKMSPDKGYKILDVRVNNSSNDDAIKNGRLTLQNITSDMRVDVSFVKDDSSIVYLNVYAGEGGKAYGSGYYEKGSQVPIFAIADNGYEFKRWSNGSTSATTSVTVIDNMDIQATFEKSSLFGGGSVGNSDNIIYVALVIVVILGIAFVFAWAFTRNKG